MYSRYVSDESLRLLREKVFKWPRLPMWLLSEREKKRQKESLTDIIGMVVGSYVQEKGFREGKEDKAEILICSWYYYRPRKERIYFFMPELNLEFERQYDLKMGPPYYQNAKLLASLAKDFWEYAVAHKEHSGVSKGRSVFEFCSLYIQYKKLEPVLDPVEE